MPIGYAQHKQSARPERKEVIYTANTKKNYAVSFVINLHDSTLTKKHLKVVAQALIDELQAGFKSRFVSGNTGDCSFNVHNLERPLAKTRRAMSWQDIEESIGARMDALENLPHPYQPILVRMSDGNPITGARVLRSAQGSSWEVWLSDADT